MAMAASQHPAAAMPPQPVAPVARPPVAPTQDRQPIQKSYWSDNEDRLLTSLVELYGAKNWSLIAKSFHGRIGKQCRERWRNHLNPTIRKEPFTSDEDARIMELVNELGTKWTKIALRLPGRSDNAIKNRYYSSLKRSHLRPTPAPQPPPPQQQQHAPAVVVRVEDPAVVRPAADTQTVPNSPEHNEPGSTVVQAGQTQSLKRKEPEPSKSADCAPPEIWGTLHQAPRLPVQHGAPAHWPQSASSTTPAVYAAAAAQSSASARAASGAGVSYPAQPTASHPTGEAVGGGAHSIGHAASYVPAKRRSQLLAADALPTPDMLWSAAVTLCQMRSATA